MMLQKLTAHILYVMALIICLQSCEKKDIDFGTALGESYTSLTKVDSISVNMSTYFVDSFNTTKPLNFLVGRYKDPELGIVSAKPFLQLALPANISLSNDAVYDSVTFVIRSKKYYYGDTSLSQTIQVRELDAPIEYGNNNYLYNTSDFAEKNSILGERNVTFSPNRDDSIVIRLNDSKGIELFNKMKLTTNEMLTQDAFLNYFKGVSVSFAAGDLTAIYGITDSVCLRVHYHTTIPYRVESSKDFLWYSGGIYFNQLVADRTGTTIATLLANTREISSTLINNKVYSQGALGVLAKATFPTIRSLIQDNPTIKIVKAELVLRVAAATYDRYILTIPEKLYMETTNGTNTIGSPLVNASSAIIYGYPVIDNIYDGVPYYTLDVTAYISKLILSGGLEDEGIFIYENYPGENSHINRAVFNNYPNPIVGSQLILTVLTIKN